MGVWWQNRGRDGAMLTPMNLFLVSGVFIICTNFCENQIMRVCTDGQTDAHTQTGFLVCSMLYAIVMGQIKSEEGHLKVARKLFLNIKWLCVVLEMVSVYVRTSVAHQTWEASAMLEFFSEHLLLLFSSSYSYRVHPRCKMH